MTKNPTKRTTPEPESDGETVISPEQQALSYLKANRADVYNFEEDHLYKVRASSLILTAQLNGGMTPGAHRALGVTTGGKTHCTLDFMYHFLQQGAGHRGVYVKAEGRLPEETKLRSGITYTTDATQWKDGTCFILESNVYEAVFGFIGDLIRNNPTNTRYFFILDSLDMMAKRDDLAKPLEEAGQVAGGALLTSVFLKKTSAALAKRGHICWFISQFRESIKLNPYEKAQPRQGNASGGHAVEHQGDIVLEFLPRWGDDIIRAGAEKTAKPIGHYCRVKVIKDNNESYGQEVRYPIRYKRTNAQSVWVEREIVDLMLGWEMLEKKGSWLRIDPAIRTEVKDATGVELPEQVQGLEKAYQLLEDQPAVCRYLFDKFLALVTASPVPATVPAQ